MDLFKAIVPPADQHHNFRTILNAPHYAPERDIIQGWADGFVDRDNKFVHEFQTSFNSCFWELYLHACFRKLGASIDWGHTAPDFLLRLNHQDLAAEATIASHAGGYLAEWELTSVKTFDIDQHELVRAAPLRISNAFSAKLRAYKERYATMDHVQGRPFVLCIGAYDQPFFYLQKDLAIRRVLYGIEQPIWIPGDNGDRIVVGESRRPSEQKDNGTQVGFELFSKPGCEEISAVIFSSTATFGKVHALAKSEFPIEFMAVRYNDHGTEPLNIVADRSNYIESLLDGLHVYLNPFAAHPINVAPWIQPDVAVHQVDKSSGEYSCFVSHGHLFSRMCRPAHLQTDAEATPRSAANSKKEQHARKELPQGDLFSVPGTLMTFTDNHFAHYRGWTIVVAFDLVDRNWGWLAHTGQARSIPEFRKLNEGDLGTAAMCQDWFETKELSFADAKAAIDSATTA